MKKKVKTIIITIGIVIIVLVLIHVLSAWLGSFINNLHGGQF
jgi:hypothetical protein